MIISARLESLRSLYSRLFSISQADRNFDKQIEQTRTHKGFETEMNAQEQNYIRNEYIKIISNQNNLFARNTVVAATVTYD